MFEVLRTIGSIILVDLMLSGDNALIIGAAAAGLPRQQRWIAIVGGGGTAILLRIVFAIAATFLLQLPLLQAIGGILLLIIAVRLLAERNTREHTRKPQNIEKDSLPATQADKKQRGIWAALLTIMVADVTMSLDNVLAIGALASGEILYLIIGILISISLLLLGSALIAELIGKLPWVMDLAALVLAWTAANMILNDLKLSPFLNDHDWTQYVIPLTTLTIVVIADILLRIRDSRRAHAEPYSTT